MRSLLLPVVLVACGSTETTSSPVADTSVEEDPVFGGDRPVPFFRAPDGYDRKKPIPLVMVLHGFGAGGYAQAAYFGLAKLVEEKKFLLVAPDGTPDSKGRRFWNAVDVCCDFDRKGVDDVKYLTGLVDEIAKYWTIDRKRVFLLGHSNGGAMSYRLACDAAPRFAAVVTLAPPFYDDTTKCNPSEPVAVRHMHGTSDETVPYDGGPASSVDPGTPGRFPPAQKIVDAWAKWNGCGATPDTSGAPLEIDNKAPGAETKVSRYTGCKPNGDVELWRMEGTTHIPFDLSPELPAKIWAFFEAHPKP